MLRDDSWLVEGVLCIWQGSSAMENGELGYKADCWLYLQPWSVVG